MRNIIGKIEKSGPVDAGLLGVHKLLVKVSSVVRICILRMRSYRIDYSVSLGTHFSTFQSARNSITIRKGTYIGDGVRIKAGFTGKIYIGKNVLIDDYSILDAQKNIRVGDETMIASHVYIIDYNHKYPLSKSKKHLLRPEGYESKPISIGEHVWIGTHAVILRNVTIGNNAVVGAGAIVTKNVPSNSIVAGNPAKVIKKIK